MTHFPFVEDDRLATRSLHHLQLVRPPRASGDDIAICKDILGPIVYALIQANRAEIRADASTRPVSEGWFSPTGAGLFNPAMVPHLGG